MRQYSTIQTQDKTINAPRAYRLHCAGLADPFYAEAGESLLQALRRVAPQHPSMGCANGGCGICRVQIQTGEYTCGLMSAAQVSMTDREQGIVLACRTFPASDLAFVYLGKPK